MGVVYITKEQEVLLFYIAAGLTDGDIADAMCVSIGTIKQRLIAVREALGVDNRCQAIAKMMCYSPEFMTKVQRHIGAATSVEIRDD